jgi:hypothetical protein
MGSSPRREDGRCPYLKRSKSNQIASPSNKNRHFHLLNKAILNNSRFFTPNPPLSLGRQIWSQLTQQSFLSFKPPPHKEFLWILTNCWMMHLGAFEKGEKIKRETR